MNLLIRKIARLTKVYFYTDAKQNIDEGIIQSYTDFNFMTEVINVNHHDG